MLEKIRNLLINSKINFKEIHHKETKTSEDSARERGEDISVGGKALILKIDDCFKIFVLSASLKLDSLAVKKYFNSKKIRFATEDELFKLTGLVPGSVPPFGEPIINLELYLDNSILKNKIIGFNAGSLTDSIIINVDDYLKISNPIIFNFSKE